MCVFSNKKVVGFVYAQLCLYGYITLWLSVLKISDGVVS